MSSDPPVPPRSVEQPVPPRSVEQPAPPRSFEQPVPRFFIALIVAALVLLGYILYPIASEIFLAAVLAGVLWPLQQWLTRRTRGRRTLPAGLLTVAVILLLIGPVAGIAAFIIRDGADGVRFVSQTVHSKNVAQLIRRLPEPTQDTVNDALRRVPRNLNDVVGKVDPEGNATAAAVTAAVSATGSFAFHGAMMVIALFFLLVRGDELVRWLDTVSPLGPGHLQELLATFKRVSYAVVVSTIVTSGVQAAAALVGYMIAQVPSPIFFALVTFFGAFIPAIGAGVVCLAAAGLLLLTGHPYWALFLAVWGTLVVGLVDNLVKPLLIRRGLEIHGAVVFFALIGGLSAFGAIGLLVGPLVVAMVLALVRIYHRDYTPGDPRVPAVPGLAGDATRRSPPTGVAAR